jgi:hypothetical protein
LTRVASDGLTHAPVTNGVTVVSTAVPSQSPLNGANSDCADGDVVSGWVEHDALTTTSTASNVARFTLARFMTVPFRTPPRGTLGQMTH